MAVKNKLHLLAAELKSRLHRLCSVWILNVAKYQIPDTALVFVSGTFV